MAARLEITDGTTVIDLIQTGGNPFYLNSWRPAIIQPKGGGTFQQSSLSDGRRLVDRKYNNAIETFDLVVKGDDPDALAAALHDLRVLLEKAVSYWTTNYQDTPVYLIAQAECEEYERYAIIHNWSTPEDENPYAQPFNQGDASAVMDSWTLIIERGDWLENAPGDSTCVQIGGFQTVANDTEVIAYPLITNDDCYVSETAQTIALATGNMFFGNLTAESRNAGVRFRSVQVPAGATISSAFVRFTAGDNQAGTDCNAIVYGERNDEPAAFSTFANFQGRTRTTNGIAWNGIAAWTAGNTYDTPDIADIIQEIINLGNWTIGDDIVIFVEDNSSDLNAYRAPASIDSETYDEPELHITFGDRVAGRTATCENEVYIANKHNQAQLTDVYVSDGGAFGVNLIGAVPPYNLLPAVPAVDDRVYFGIDTTLANTGPFSSLVFDLSVAQDDLTITWQYSRGAGVWSTLTVTDHTDTIEPLDTTGVNSVHWVPPANWATDTVNLVTGYWVRANVSAVGVAPSPPVQQNRDVYTIIWPYIELAATEISGDLPAFMQYKIFNQSYGSSVGVLETNRIFVGLRSYSRGSSFTAYLNVSDEQNPTGITVSLGGSVTYSNVTTSPTGRRAEYSPAVAEVSASRVLFQLSSAIAPDYYGEYHAFIRGAQVGGALGDIGVSLRLETGTVVTPVEIWETDEKYFETTADVGDFQLLDMGLVKIPSDAINADDTFSLLLLRILASNTNATAPPDAYFHDLILIPIDEWAGDFSGQFDITPSYFLQIDSVERPKRVTRALIREADSNEYVTAFYRNIVNGPIMAQANARQRYWFVATRLVSATDSVANFDVSHSLQSFGVQRYFSYRGNG